MTGVVDKSCLEWLVSDGLRPWRLTGATFFAIGTRKGRLVGQRCLFTGLETLYVGGCAAALACLWACRSRG